MSSWELIGIEPHRVYQRNESNHADLAFQIQTAGNLTGRVEGRISSDPYSTPWMTIGEILDCQFSGQLRGVPVGRHGIEIRIVSTTTTETTFVEPVFVGDLWLLAGQSNMEGCGKLVNLETPVEGVSCYYMGDRWGLAVEPLCWLREAVDPVHHNIPPERLEEERRAFRRDRTRGAGLGLAFGKEVMRHTGIPIGLVMCAHGGTTLSHWDPSLLGEGGRSFYGAMIRRVRALGGRIKGCLWYQGESDANESASPLYEEKMKQFVSCLRRDVSDEELPFIYAQLSLRYNNLPDFNWWNLVQDAQWRLEEQLKPAGMVTTIDATLSDGIHLDASSLIKVGRRMAWRALSLVYRTKHTAPGPRPSGFEWNSDRTELRILLSGMNGKLMPVERVFGFQVEVNQVSQPFAARIGDDKEEVRLQFEQPVPNGQVRLRHGAGYNPDVNVADELGIPLCVFGPVDLKA